MIGLSYSITPNRNAPFSNDLKIPDFFCPELSSKGNLALEGFTFHICASSGARANVIAEFELTQLDSHHRNKAMRFAVVNRMHLRHFTGGVVRYVKRSGLPTKGLSHAIQSEIRKRP